MNEFVVPKGVFYERILQQAKEGKLPLDASMLETLLQLLQFMNNFSSTVEKYFGRYGLSQGRFGIMVLLFIHPENVWIPADLAASLGVTRATVTGLLDSLEKSNLVERQIHSQDRRKLIVKLTQDGSLFIQNMLPEHSQRFSQLLVGLSNQEQKTLMELLAKVSQGLWQITEN